MLTLPLHPRLARMVVAAADADKGLACLIAAVLDKATCSAAGPTSCPQILAATRPRDVVVTTTTACRSSRCCPPSLTAPPTSPGEAMCTSISTTSLPNTPAPCWLWDFRPASRYAAVNLDDSQCAEQYWVAATDNLANERFIVAADLDGNRTTPESASAAQGIEPDELIRSLGDDVERQHLVTWDKRPRRFGLASNRAAGFDGPRRAVPTCAIGDETVAALVERVRATHSLY